MAHQEPGWVLVDYGKHIGSFHRRAYEPLKEVLGIGGMPTAGGTKILDRMAQNVVLDEAVCQRLGIDFRWVVPHWVGVRDVEIDGQKGYVDMWHTPHRYTEIGHYYAVAGNPLDDPQLTIADVEAFDWPDPHNPAMFEALEEQARNWYENTDYVVGADGIKVGVLQTASQLRGYDKLFTDFALNPDLAHALLDKISGIINAMYRRYMDVVGPYVQVVCITDDQGTQDSLLVSPDMFREFIKPRLREQIATIKGTADVRVLFHCDGAVLPLTEDFIDIGVDILNPIQTVVKGFDDTRALKEEYGDRICFHGAIDVQQVMPNASPAEMRCEVARRIHDLGSSGGYILAPCHNIDVDVPVENVLAMFDAARDYGSYPLQLGQVVRDCGSRGDFFIGPRAVALEEVTAPKPEEAESWISPALSRRHLDALTESIIKGDQEGTIEQVKKALESGCDPIVILNEGMIAAMETVGDRFERSEVFVPEMIIAANAMQAGLAHLRPSLIEADVKPVGILVLGTVEGDLHDIGKNLVGMMCEGAGFEVIDLGTDVKPERFVEAVREHQPDAVGMSALLTTTLPAMRHAIEALEEAGIRDQVAVMVGGAPVTQRFADEAGADLYAKDASAAARCAKKHLMDM
jgi:corrinoid protein of di/trimethylamine methyltransferase